jgi:N-sulfoglucosamine sulfohydrolase
MSLPWISACSIGKTKTNVLFITADDMNWDSVGIYGSKVPNITPNIDRLAGEGLRFEHAHVNIAVCQPCRQSILTGRYPHNNGATGFDPIRMDVPTLNEQLKAAGYMNGVLGKSEHYQPKEKFCWDMVADREELNNGRDPELHYEQTKRFLAMADEAGKPFFLHVNSRDPHRPLEKANGNSRYPYTRAYRTEEVEVPEFLPDIPDVRKEVTWYFNSVHRSDETVGRVLDALEESGMAENTLVIFLSDHGMAFPYSKTNVYLNSTKTPLIVRWPGRIKPGTVDRENLIAGVDIMPTLMDVAGLRKIAGMDGHSFYPLLCGKSYQAQDTIFTMFHTTIEPRDYPMRSVLTKKFSYIYNAWSDGKTVFWNNSQRGLSMNAMKRAAKEDAFIAERVRHFLYRVPEEFYDLKKDPNGLVNLIDDPNYRAETDAMREQLRILMERTNDPLLNEYETQILKGLTNAK